ncbi:MAG: hypothetical protein IPJ84_15015 [Bdellovibrionales bacterium]|nr:hypothetical protein [Bdellovibrionales bacterium]
MSRHLLILLLNLVVSTAMAASTATTVEVPPRYRFTSTLNSKLRTTDLEVGIINELSEPADERMFFTVIVLAKKDPSLERLSATTRLSRLKVAVSAMANESHLKNSGIQNSMPYVLYEGPRNRIWAARESNEHIIILKTELRTTDKVKARAELIQLLRGLVVSP